MKEKVNFLNVYSYSKLDQFRRCPRQYYFSYLDPEIAPLKYKFKKVRDYQTKGHSVHNAIVLFFHLPLQKRNFENLKKCLKEAWFSEIDPSKKPPLGKLGGFRSIEHERKVYKESLRLLKNFFEISEINPSLFYLPTAKIKNSYKDYQDLIQPINNIFFISGKFDQINYCKKGLEVIDYKTGKENADPFQLHFYKILAELNFKKPVKKAVFYYLETKRKKEIDLSGLSLKKIKEEILEKIKRIESTKNFFPRYSSLCHHCDFFELCHQKT